MALVQRVEKILWWHPSHAGRSICLECRRCLYISLSVTLHSVEDDAQCNDQEDTSKGNAERNEDNKSRRETR